ncbi:MAG: helix-turn-helix domain-containing protein [Nitrospirae bacterium]|nr:helix-turn-helix domain-containing protein [Fimbriimonadaceae bacterium]
MKTLLSVDEAARELGVKRSSLYALIMSGELASVKVGKRRLIPSGAVAGYVAELLERDGFDPSLALANAGEMGG